MIKKIEILGIQLDNYTVREAAMLVENYLTDDVPNAVEHISMRMLVDAESDAILKDAISALSLAVIGDKEILQAAGAGTMQQIREIEENDFFSEFFKRIERNGKSIFLLGKTSERIAWIRERLSQEFPRLTVAGEYATEACVGVLDAVINDMNAATPDVIVSVLPSPMQEHFFWEYREKMNAKIWYGIGDIEFHTRQMIRQNVRSVIKRIRLKNQIKKYREKRRKEERMENDGNGEE